MLNLAYYVSLCEGLHAGADSSSYVVHVNCCGLSMIVIKDVIIINKSMFCTNAAICILNFRSTSTPMLMFTRNLTAVKLL